MKTGIVILNYNSFGLTKELVKHCLEMNVFDYVLIVDNNSNDDFTEFHNEMNNNRLLYIKSKTNGGYAFGNNIGLRKLKELGCRIAYIANPDVWFEKEVIYSINDAISNFENIAVCSCSRFMHSNGKTGQFWWTPTYFETLIESLHICRKFLYKKFQRKSYELSEKNDENLCYVEVVGGAFFGCDLEIMESIGYLDENTFLWYEENILGYKIKKNNYKEAFIKNVYYNHNHGKSKKGNEKFKIFINSKKHYCYNYLNINSLQKVILSIFDIIGSLEEKVICLIFNR